jgi:hypothetical protein
LPAGAALELSAPSVPDELVERVLAGKVPVSPAAIRREKSTDRTSERSYEVDGTFIDHLMRFKGNARTTLWDRRARDQEMAEARESVVVRPHHADSPR